MIPLELYFQTLAAGILGIAFHIFAVKLPSVKARSQAANLQFSIRSYFKDDWIAIGASVITLLLAILTLDEILGYKPALLRYIKYFFFFIGFTGSSILIAILGKTNKAINAVVDIKTNIADQK